MQTPAVATQVSKEANLAAEKTRIDQTITNTRASRHRVVYGKNIALDAGAE
jgi:hypothetical protein